MARAEVQILDLSDFSAGPAAGALSDVVLQDEVCVRVTGGQDSYRLRIDGQDGQGFTLTHTASGTSLPFSIVWDSLAGASRARSAPGEVGVFAVSDDSCAADAWRAVLEIRIAREAIVAGLAGDYRGGLLIEISSP